MDTPEFKEDLKGIQNKLLTPGMSPKWSDLKALIQDFMNVTRRTWGHAVFYLLEKGLEYERNERIGRTDEGHKKP